MSTSQEIKKDEPNQPVKISIYQVRLRLSTFQRYTKGLRLSYIPVSVDYRTYPKYLKKQYRLDKSIPYETSC